MSAFTPLFEPVCRALFRSAAAAGPAIFSPSSLFAAGEQGAWYDPSDITTLFQDDAGTVPVTASGQSVGRMLDKSGRGNHATQPTALARPIFTESAGLRSLAFANSFMVTGNIDFSATDKVTVFAGIQKATDVVAGSLVELSSSPTNNGVFAILAPNGAAQAGYGFRSRGTADSFLATPMTYAAPTTNVVTGLGNIAADGNAIRVNGVQVASQATDQGAGAYGLYPIYLGMRGGVSNPFTGNLYGLILRGAASSAAEIASSESYLRAKTGITF